MSEVSQDMAGEDHRVERRIYSWLWLALAVLKALALLHYRADSDETQHAHVVWGWTTGRLPYRDLFDNHMPLFQMMLAPVMWLLGERADILVWLRVAMLPLYAAAVWCVYLLGRRLYGVRAGAWAALYGAACSAFFLTSTEFRTDNLWAAAWIGALLVALSGRFTAGRAFWAGMCVGVAFGVSMKSVALLVAAACAGAVALALHLIARGRLAPPGRCVVRLLAGLAGIVLVPGALFAWFAWQGALWEMDYCVFVHNLLPGLRRWSWNPLVAYIFPGSVLTLAAYAWLIRRRCEDAGLAGRRIVAALTPALCLALLLSYWPELTREDALPYAPLLPLAAVPLVMEIGRWTTGQRSRRVVAWLLPLGAAAELVYTLRTGGLLKNRLRETTHELADVLALTQPGDSVLDSKGDYIFRPRSCYWVFEPMTLVRIRRGLIQCDLRALVEKTRTKLCYFYAAKRAWPDMSVYLARHYLPVDPLARDFGVAGCEIGADGAFEVTIATGYCVVSESGETRGALDGKPYTGGAVQLAPGRHSFQRNSGSGREAILLAEAGLRGCRPLFAVHDDILARALAPDPKYPDKARLRKKPEH